MTPLKLKEDGSQRGRCGEEIAQMGHPHRDAYERRQQDTPEESTPDIPDYQQSADNESDERQEDRRGVEVGEGHLCILIGNDDAAVLQAYKGDVASTATGYRLKAAVIIFFSRLFRLFFDIFFYRFFSDVADCRNIISPCPERLIPFALQIGMAVVYH